MSTEDNKAVIRRFTDALNEPNLDALDQIFAPDYVHHFGSSGSDNGAGFKQGAASIIEAFPDVQGRIEHMIAEGDIVSLRWIITGTHQAPFLGIPPTGNKITCTFNIIARVKDGRVQEDWEESDFPGLLQQIGFNLFADLG
jgi:C-1 hydroxylase